MNDQQKALAELPLQLRSLEDFYSWSAQHMMRVPSLEDLTQTNQIKWRDDYAQALREFALQDKAPQTYSKSEQKRLATAWGFVPASVEALPAQAADKTRDGSLINTRDCGGPDIYDKHFRHAADIEPSATRSKP